VFNPDNTEEISCAIEKEMEAPYNNEISKSVSTMRTWHDVGMQIKGIYEQVVARRTFEK